MKKLLMITGDIAAGKSTFSRLLSDRYHVAAFQKDTIKEELGDFIGFRNREENKKLSDAAIAILCRIFSEIAKTGNSVILEANFHTEEQKQIHRIANANHYDVLTLVLRGDANILYERYLHRMKDEHRHPVHLSTTLHIKDDFLNDAESFRNEAVIGDFIEINATDFSYQSDKELLRQLDKFMEI